MTVPVWISHKDNPEDEHLIYALLDSQSDSTFLLKKTCDSLGLKGATVNIRLSTMLSENELICSQKIDS